MLRRTKGFTPSDAPNGQMVNSASRARATGGIGNPVEIGTATRIPDDVIRSGYEANGNGHYRGRYLIDLPTTGRTYFACQ
jgi:hypothetical protein